ncbi:MAG: hypothetical protein DBY41_05765 [Clostridium sp.]|nr:MAG: hypothetical protein DBY41_05765 [Clostridium sp.]
MQRTDQKRDVLRTDVETGHKKIPPFFLLIVAQRRETEQGGEEDGGRVHSGIFAAAGEHGADAGKLR